jgi:hypothetical protein
MNTILNIYSRTTTFPQRPRDLEDICGNFIGYLIHPSGHVISKNRHKFVKHRYRGCVPYISLCENNVTTAYRLDQVVWRSFHCTYIINSETILHKDGDQGNCRIKNLVI